eukprot:757066-Pelagomonas_calceolata.AAC.1
MQDQLCCHAPGMRETGGWRREGKKEGMKQGVRDQTERGGGLEEKHGGALVPMPTAPHPTHGMGSVARERGWRSTA